MEKTQSIPNGTLVKFDSKGLEFDDFQLISEGHLSDIEGRVFSVVSLETYVELGDKDYEYYNLKSPYTGQELSGISGYNLELA